MNERERYLEALLFGPPDRIPLNPTSGRESTREAWYRQGLPKDIPPGEIARHAFDQIGSPYAWPEGGGAGDFVTRKWIKCPVESWQDWEEMKTRYDPNDPSRLPVDPAAKGRELKDRTWPVTFHFSGPFWQMREWLGFENLCTQFYDDPDMIRDMVTFWTDYVSQLLEDAFEHCIPDGVHLSEDMAYKAFSMVSPAMAREFLYPAWKQWGDLVKNQGVPVYAMDSDGFIGELIPIWIDAGINACDPIEVAAHNDIAAFRDEFGRKMAYRGGVDKRKMAAGGEALEEEFLRIRPVVDDGGYIPSCDHAIPADVSWSNYLQYMNGLAGLTG